MEIESDVFMEHKFIDKQYLGKIIKIFTFFQYFDELFEGAEFTIEELYACMLY